MPQTSRAYNTQTAIKQCTGSKNKQNCKLAEKKGISPQVSKLLINFKALENFFPKEWQEETKQWSKTHKDIVQTDLKYEGYIKKQQTQLKQYRKMHLHSIPNNLDYSLIGGLSAEVREKLIQYRPENLSQMLKISGITPAAATILMIYLKNQGKPTQNENKSFR